MWLFLLYISTMGTSIAQWALFNFHTFGICIHHYLMIQSNYINEHNKKRISDPKKLLTIYAIGQMSFILTSSLLYILWILRPWFLIRLSIQIISCKKKKNEEKFHFANVPVPGCDKQKWNERIWFIKCSFSVP